MSIAKIRVHDGAWKAEDEIDILSSKDQTFPNVIGTNSKLGLDTEMLVRSGNEVLWPHKEGFPQERNPTAQGVTGNGNGTFDFHGDGYATELNVWPNHCLENMLSNIGLAFIWLGSSRFFKRADVNFIAPAVYKVPKELSDTAPDDIKKLGCMPSTNVYGDAGDPSSLDDNKRTTGCHLHISHIELQNELAALALVKWADILVGNTWTYISPALSKTETERRKAYGRAGEFRLKTYPVFPVTDMSSNYRCGVEYRVLPGTVMHNPSYLTMMFNLYRSAMRMAVIHGEPKGDLAMQAKAAINNADKRLAKSIIRSLPFSKQSRQLIRFIRRNPLPLTSIQGWYDKGRNHKGHQELYADNKLRIDSQRLLPRNL